ncbi:hypothetical protein [Rhodopirellula sallentina]|uniref:Uncharacterized protein n=1 Tax=Rhodopirellula sallentina SM41 TaxID=1263870 RepID=M5TUU9_9BACT|nr:hypothetical protein [Rhodopirellula sallentina]EMI52814.1 hypothetical protein RSSM_05761 [Rhodopirellula sallentina SM41]
MIDLFDFVFRTDPKRVVNGSANGCLPWVLRIDRGKVRPADKFWNRLWVRYDYGCGAILGAMGIRRDRGAWEALPATEAKTGKARYSCR